jgi:hypothetical protein
MNKIYERSYSYSDLAIPATIWNDTKVNGIQKQMLALFKKLTRDGKNKIEYMSRIQARIHCTHEKDIIYNIKQMHTKGFIKLTKESGKIWIHYTYQEKHAAPDNTQNASGLF